MIIDYSMWRPKSRSDLTGVNGVIRYIAHDAAKAITPGEMRQLHEWGIGTALVFEDAAQRPTEGTAAGTADGSFTTAQLAVLGVPHGRPVYVACDFDIRDYALASTSPLAKLGPVGQYLVAFRSQLMDHGYELGVYGGYWAVKRALDAGLTSAAWQTVAWSPSVQVLPQQDWRVRLYQSGVSVLGGQADLNFAGWRDWGQFRQATSWLVGSDA